MALSAGTSKTGINWSGLASAAAPWVSMGSSLVDSIGGWIAGAQASREASYQQELALEEARRNRDWMTWMSNTSHQREVADLKAAGLNPLLSANAGASTPAAAMAQITNNPVTEGVSNALAYKQVASNVKAAAENVKLMAQQRKNGELDYSSNKYIMDNLLPEQVQGQITSNAKVHQDIQNSVALTKAQVGVLSAEAQESKSRTKLNNQLAGRDKIITNNMINEGLGQIYHNIGSRNRINYEGQDFAMRKGLYNSEFVKSYYGSHVSPVFSPLSRYSGSSTSVYGANGLPRYSRQTIYY